MPSELFLVLLLLGGYIVFVWFVWRDRGTSWTMEQPQKTRAPEIQERVLFVCTHNSARSQMAEALLRREAGERFFVASAGTAPTRVHPMAEEVMAERGVSLVAHRAKSLAEVGTLWNHVITVCDAAYENCPDYPAKTSRLHWSIQDPSRLTGTREQERDAFRRVRDELAERIRTWVAERRLSR